LRAADYRSLLGQFRRLVRHDAAGEDAFHEALLVAASRGRCDLSRHEDRALVVGIARNRLRTAQRGEHRRRRREAEWGTLVHVAEVGRPAALEAYLRDLPASLRSVCALALTGHNRDEARAALGLTDTAFRQRLSALRRHMRRSDLPAVQEAFAGGQGYHRVRDALRHLLGRPDALLASRDPDGHIFVLTRSRTR
jgi:DNA-directed RNA polymerase specialized sigma24 family protein